MAHQRNQPSNGYSVFKIDNSMDVDPRILSPSSSSDSSSSYRKSSSMARSHNNNNNHNHFNINDTTGRRQEDRLLRNRSAAKECRLKKKEYVKCLEKRLKVLEDQNKQLIDQVKHLLNIVRTHSMTTGTNPSSKENEK